MCFLYAILFSYWIIKNGKTTNCISQSISEKLTDCKHCHEMQLRFTRTAEYFDARCNIKHFDICFKKNTWLNRHHCGQLRNCPLQKKPDHQVLSMLSQGIIVRQTKHRCDQTQTLLQQTFSKKSLTLWNANVPNITFNDSDKRNMMRSPRQLNGITCALCSMVLAHSCH